MEADVNTEDAEHAAPYDKTNNACPTEEPRKECQCSEQMNESKTEYIFLVPLHAMKALIGYVTPTQSQFRRFESDQ